MANVLKNLLGGIIGGAIGYFVFVWFLRQGFYAMIAPGGLLGLGASWRKHHSNWLPIVAGVAALMAGFFAEWRCFPFAKDESLGYFIAHIPDLKPVTWLMILLGAALGFYLPFAQRRRAIAP